MDENNRGFEYTLLDCDKIHKMDTEHDTPDIMTKEAIGQCYPYEILR